MNEDAAKANLHHYLRHEREAVLVRLDGLRSTTSVAR
jgi:hypothetical protein